MTFSYVTGLIGLFGFGLGVFLLNQFGGRLSFERSIEALFLLISTAIPMIIYESVNIFMFSCNNDQCVAKDVVGVGVGGWGGLWLRLIGMMVTIAVVSFVYWNFDEYHSSFLFGVFDINEEKRKEDNKPFPEAVSSKKVQYIFGKVVAMQGVDVGGGPIGDLRRSQDSY